MAVSRRGSRGFTLIEVLVAVAVIAFAFTGLLGLHNRNIAMVGNDQSLTRATLMMRELIARVELFPEFAELGSATGTFDGYPEFRWQRDVQPTQLDELREVRLRVLWGSDRNPYSAEMVYYVHVQPPA